MGFLFVLKDEEVTSMKIEAPRGTDDLLPEQTKIWQYIERQFRQLCIIQLCRN